ncbi:hypothetical protein C0991_000657, partial [Blastosporella zonata]
MPNSTTTINQASPAHPPIMSVGRLTMENLAKFLNYAEHYFAHKSIADEARVCQILFCFDDPHVTAWISTKRATLVVLDYD